MQKKEVVLVLASLIFLIGAGCEQRVGEVVIIKDIIECENIPNLNVRAECLDNFYMDQAFQTEDSSLCNLITDPGLASECEDSFVLTFEGALLQNALQDLGACDEMPLEQRQDCADNYHFNQAFDTSNFELCDEIINGELMEECFALEI